MKNLTCKTVGHSNYKVSELINIIRAHDVNCIVDVRTSPYSRYTPQFNREKLQVCLQQEGIIYIYMGDCLGGLHQNPDLLFPDGKVDYEKVGQLPLFKEGIRRVVNGITKGYRLALLCAEKDPYNCHRFILISYALKKNGVLVEHIVSVDRIITQSELEERLLCQYGKSRSQTDIFTTGHSLSDLLDEAYKRKNRDRKA